MKTRFAALALLLSISTLIPSHALETKRGDTESIFVMPDTQLASDSPVLILHCGRDMRGKDVRLGIAVAKHTTFYKRTYGSGVLPDTTWLTIDFNNNGPDSSKVAVVHTVTSFFKDKFSFERFKDPMREYNFADIAIPATDIDRIINSKDFVRINWESQSVDAKGKRVHNSHSTKFDTSQLAAAGREKMIAQCVTTIGIPVK